MTRRWRAPEKASLGRARKPGVPVSGRSTSARAGRSNEQGGVTEEERHGRRLRRSGGESRSGRPAEGRLRKQPKLGQRIQLGGGGGQIGPDRNGGGSRNRIRGCGGLFDAALAVAAGGGTAHPFATARARRFGHPRAVPCPAFLGDPCTGTPFTSFEESRHPRGTRRQKQKMSSQPRRRKPRRETMPPIPFHNRWIRLAVPMFNLILDPPSRGCATKFF